MSQLYQHELPDGFVYELEALDEGWRARRQDPAHLINGESPDWRTGDSVTHALISASFGDVPDPGQFTAAAEAWERELR